jgi:WD40 repeat protein/serine/threonine protein kinase
MSDHISTAPRVLRGYELREKLGEGGFGAVYRAYQPVIDREVAIKVILPEHANQPEFIRNFETEARYIARLEHPHIVPLFDYWRDPDGAYLVMRLIRGGSLRKIIDTRNLTLLEIGQMLDQIGGALSVAHRNRVIHRDLKPDNLLIDEDGNAYLTDFGIARTIEMGGEDTDVGVSGSIAYISPEQLRGEVPTPQMDIYSLGVMLHEMLTGKHPFIGNTPTEMVFKHLTEPLPNLLDIIEDLPGKLEDVVQKATAKDPAERYNDVRELAAAYRHAITAQTETTEVWVIDETDIINPYKGLRPFDETDADDFYGREALVDHLLKRLQDDVTKNFLAIIGPSGSGKSSVVRAGLIPALRRNELAGSEDWFVVSMIPGDNPVQNLAEALLSVAVSPPANLVEQLQADSRALDWAVNTILGKATGDLVLVIDQFEEVFTQVINESARTHFLDLLRHAVTTKKSRLRVILTMRADFIDRPLQYPDFGGLLRNRVEFILPMSPQEIEQAITAPAYRVGLQVDSNLIAAIVADVSEEPGALPLLQYALTELYERREGRFLTLMAYKAIGGVTGALAKRAEEVYASLLAPEKIIARQIFLRLVTPGEGTGDTRRRARHTELASIISDTTTMQTVLDAFGKYRLLTFDIDPETREPLVEVAHEALLREWLQLRDWINKSRDDLRLQRALSAAAADWHKAGRDTSYLLSGTRLSQYEEWAETSNFALTPEERDYLTVSIQDREERRRKDEARKAYEEELERRSVNRLRYLVAVLAVAVIGALGLSAFAVTQSQVAQNNAATAVVAQDEAVAQAEIAVTQAAIAAQNAATATIAQGEALNEAANAGTQAAIAANNAATATFAQGEAIAQAAIAETQAHIAAQNAANAETQAAIAAQNAATATIAQGEAVAQAAIAETQAAIAAQNAATATIAQGEAIAQAANAETQAAIAETQAAIAAQNAATATVAQGEAVAQAAIAGTQANIAAQSAATATIAQGQAEISALQARALALASGAQQAISNSQPDTALALALAGYEIDPISEVVWRSVFDAATFSWIRHRFQGHTSVLEGVVFSPDGQKAASGSWDDTIRIWDLATGTSTQVLTGHQNDVNEIIFSPEGQRLFSGSYDGTVKVWEVATGALIGTLNADEFAVRSLAISPDGTLLANGGNDTTIKIWDAATGDLLYTLEGHVWEVNAIAFSPDGTLLASGSGDLSVKIWDVASGTLLRTLEGHTGLVQDVAFSPQGNLIISGADDRKLRLWDVGSGALLRTFTGGHTDAIKAVAFNPDGNTVLSGGQDSALVLWDVVTGALLRRMTGHTNTIFDVAFSPDGRAALSGGSDNQLILWDTGTDDILKRLPGHTDDVLAVAISPDGRYALSGSNDTTMILWDITTGQVVRNFEAQYEIVTSIVFTPDGTKALSGSYSLDLVLWDVATGSVLHQFAGHNDVIDAVAVSADGKLAATASFDNTSIIWNLETYEKVHTLTGHTGLVTGVSFSPDGRYLLTGATDRTLRLWDIDTGELVRVFSGHSGGVTGVIFSPDGTLALSGSEDTTLIVWDIATGRARHILRGHRGVAGGVFSPDGASILSYSFDKSLILWDTRTGQPERRFQGHSAGVMDVAFLPDGGQAISVSEDKTLMLWRIEPYINGLLDWTQQNRFIPPLTCDQRDTFNVEPPCDPQATPTPPAPFVAFVPQAISPMPPTATPFTDLPAVVENTLLALNFSPENGALAAYIESTSLVLQDTTNVVETRFVGGTYRNFVIGTDVTWDTNTLQRCGFTFRHTDFSNYYLALIGTDQYVLFDHLVNDRWDNTRFIANETIGINQGDSHRLVLVAINDTFTFYLNGVYVGQYQDATRAAGRVGIRIDNTEEAAAVGCTFDDVWVWDFGDNVIQSPPAPPANTVLKGLALAGIAPDSGFVAATSLAEVVDLTGENDVIEWETLLGSYVDFVAGTTILWGPGAEEDECGLLFRQVDNDNFQNVTITRQGNLGFTALIDSEWQAYTALDGTAVRGEAAARNDFVLVGIGDTFQVYLNGGFVGEYQSDVFAQGSISVMATTYDESDEAHCTYLDSWVWQFYDNRVPVAVTPTPTAAPPPNSVVLNILDTVGASPNNGYLAASLPLARVDMTGIDDMLRWQFLPGVYTDFVVGTTIQWGPGAADDECGLRFRSVDSVNFHTVGFDRLGNLYFQQKINDEWRDPVALDSRNVNTAANQTNQFILVGSGATFTAFINGVNVGQFENGDFVEGSLALLGTTYQNSDETYCTFTDTYIWSLDEGISDQNRDQQPARR